MRYASLPQCRAAHPPYLRPSSRLLFQCAALPLLFWTFVLAFISAPHLRTAVAASPAVAVPLELRPPRLVRQPSPHGFHSHVQLFDPAAPSERSLPRRLLSRVATTVTRDAAPPPAPFTSRVVAVDLLGGITKVGEYYTRIYVGGQPIRVQVDTGSSTLAFPVAECEHCLPSDQRYNPRLSQTHHQRWISCINPLCARDMCPVHGCAKCSATDACCADENPQACAFFLKYGDGSGARGGLMVDKMTWGNVSAPVIFGAILHDTDDFERAIVDGILGMAYKSLACNPTCVEPPFQQMVKAGVVADEFSICITQQGGKLILGEFDHSLANSPVSYVPLALSDPPTFYTMNVSNTLTIDSRKLQIPNLSAGILDSGTTLIVVSKVFFNLLFNHLVTFYCKLPGLCKTDDPWFRPAGCVYLTPDQLAILPTITFHLGSNGEFDLELRPEDYMLRLQKNGREYRCVGIMTMDTMSGGTDIIFGNTVMQRYATHYDRAKKRLGFAEAKPGCGGSTHCASYTSCMECASIPGCSFDFRDLKCRESRGGLGLVPYPECEGSTCFCKLGPQTGLVFGLGAGVIGSLMVVAVGMFVIVVYRGRGTAGSDAGQTTDTAPLYSIGDDDEEFAGDVQQSKRYLPVAPE